MKRMHEIEINREWFQVETLTARESANAIVAAHDHRYTYADIYDAYQKPSEAKVSIWNEWVDWARDVNMLDGTYEVLDLRIGSASCFMFTVVAVIREFAVDETGNRIAVATYIMRVTKYHQYLYRLASDESGDDIDVCW